MRRQSRIRRGLAAGTAVCLLAACNSTPPAPVEPPWIHQPTRTVDAGYLVYIGTGMDANPDRARFKAEASALEDLANECSFVPKGARVEDHYDETVDRAYRSFAKVGLTLEECEQAKNTVQPDQVRLLANVPMTEEIKRYQEIVGGDGLPTAEASPAPVEPGAPLQTDDQYFVARQQIFVAKQIVILAPPSVYVPESPLWVRYYEVVNPAVTQVHTYEVANPAIRTWNHGWSGYAAQVRSPGPPGFRGGRNARPRNRPPSRAPRRRRRKW
jgi:hypothetical protein